MRDFQLTDRWTSHNETDQFLVFSVAARCLQRIAEHPQEPAPFSISFARISTDFKRLKLKLKLS